MGDPTGSQDEERSEQAETDDVEDLDIADEEISERVRGGRRVISPS